MAGQVDLLMRNEDSTEYHILDYKFIKEPLEKRVTTTDLLGSIK
jgi:ATP-dependent exoDNAse (exonuclease V) beta subunit